MLLSTSRPVSWFESEALFGASGYRTCGRGEQEHPPIRPELQHAECPKNAGDVQAIAKMNGVKNAAAQEGALRETARGEA